MLFMMPVHTQQDHITNTTRIITGYRHQIRNNYADYTIQKGKRQRTENVTSLHYPLPLDSPQENAETVPRVRYQQECLQVSVYFQPINCT